MPSKLPLKETDYLPRYTQSQKEGQFLNELKTTSLISTQSLRFFQFGATVAAAWPIAIIHVASPCGVSFPFCDSTLALPRLAHPCGWVLRSLLWERVNLCSEPGSVPPPLATWVSTMALDLTGPELAFNSGQSLRFFAALWSRSTISSVVTQRSVLAISVGATRRQPHP